MSIMKTYKVVVSAALLLLVSMLVSAVPESSTPQKKYISQYAETAVREMYRSGVPASITLAQGLLESRYGQSPLAKEGNNHFGIKCHDWTGKKMYHDDDKRGECFRVYKSADESFRDHSDFLRYRDRYKSLFDNEITDYKAWAYGLKKAGYATDPAYPAKLIKIIEDYQLYDYDSMKPENFGEGGTVSETVSEAAPGQKPDTHRKKSSRKHKRSEVKEEKIISARHYHTIMEVKNGEGPHPIKTPKGWLHLAHGVRGCASGLRYVLYMYMTALNDPTNVIAQPGGYFLVPEGEEYVGDVMNVAFANGWIEDEDGRVLIYYASSDTRMHVAVSTVDKLVDYCMNTPEDGFTTTASVETIKKLIQKNRENGVR